MTLVLFAAGLALLIVGAEALVRGASRIAGSFGMSPLVIGLTVVAFGTSAPELGVSIKSAVSGQAGIALGNVVGSNIFNVLFILGVSALIVPLRVAQQLIRLDVPLMIALSILVLVLSLDRDLNRLEGLVLVAGLVCYVWFLIRQGRQERGAEEALIAKDSSTTAVAGSSRIKDIGLVGGGLLFLVLGSRWLVDGAVSFALYLGVSELVVGLTIVAAGTSLPEVVTSVVAALRGERDIAVGNVVGSNIFNIMGVLGLTCIVAPAGIDVSAAVIGFDLPVMIAVAAACLPLFFTGGELSRWEGAGLLGYYLIYVAYLILAASHHDALSVFSMVMMYFVIPFTAAVIIVVALQEIRRRK